jgi:subtilisin-like proprotein convertase family protein
MKSLNRRNTTAFLLKKTQGFWAVFCLVALISINIGHTTSAESSSKINKFAGYTKDENGMLVKRTATVDQFGNSAILATYCNTTAITIPSSGNGTPYPSAIVVSGEPSNITNVTVNMIGATHTFSDDIDVMMVGPGGTTADALYLMSDAGGSVGLDAAADLTIDDAAATVMPDSAVIATGSWRPTNYGASDTMTGATPTTGQNPATAGTATLASVYNTKNPNGTWNLYVRDDVGGDTGTIAGGWCVNITAVNAAPTVEFSGAVFNVIEGSGTATIIVNRNGGTAPAVSVDYATSAGTATAGSDYTDVSGTLNFVSGDTQETFTVPIATDFLSEDPAETVTLTLSNPVGATITGTNPATLNIQDAATQFTGGSIVINDVLPASPYPSSITVSGAAAAPTRVRVTIFSMSHTFPADVRMLLVSPTGATFTPMVAAGGGTDIVGTTFTFEDAATTIIPNATQIFNDNYEPANYLTPVPNFPAPAPAGPYTEPGSTLRFLGGPTLNTTFAGNPNGQWDLYVQDTAGGDVGTIGSWGLEFLSPTAGPADLGGRVTTADGRPIKNARVTASGGGLAQPVSVLTNQFGKFRFDDLPSGQTYVIEVNSKRYTFTNPTRVINLDQDFFGADFVAEP